MTTRISRRTVLGGTAALVVAFSLAPKSALAKASAKNLSPNQVDGFLAIDKAGKVTVYSGKVDLGTGVRTALTQMVAEELDIPMERVELIEGDTALTPDQGPTYGSLSIQNGGMQLRQAAATARQALLDKAARRLGAERATLLIEAGVVVAPSGRRVSLAALVDGEPLALEIDKTAPVKPSARFTLVGKSVPRLDIPDKISGRFAYMQDFVLPGMLHGRVVRPPAIGAALQSVDEDSIRGIPGVVKLVRERNFLGVVATDEWAAIKAARQLKAAWSAWQGLPEQATLWDHVRGTKIRHDDVTSNIGDAEGALGGAAKRLRATYDFAIHTHGSIGPSCAVARFDGAKVTCWTASQAVHSLRFQLAAMLHTPPDNVRCIYVEGAGCYGRNGHEDAAADAVLLARAVGAPVRVQWMRADEHGWDPKGPPTLIDLEAGLDATGKVAAWHSAFFYPDGAGGNVDLVGAELAGLPSDAGLNPGNVINNTALPYGFPNIRTVAHRLESTPLKPSWIRTPGRLQNTFANESFLDELAAAAKLDPLEIRLAYLNDARGREVLERLATLAQWRQRPRGAKTGDVVVGRGLAYVKYELYRTYVGAVAEIRVDRKSGALTAERFYVVQDCGQIINPDGVRNQIEGNVVQTVSRSLKEAVTFDRSAVTSLDWASYPILTFPEIPDVVMDLIDRPDEPPWGSGEPSAAVVPAAIANAVFDAVGARLRSVPFTPAKVKAAIDAA